MWEKAGRLLRASLHFSWRRSRRFMFAAANASLFFRSLGRFSCFLSNI
jgi:hypothetical protein